MTSRTLTCALLVAFITLAVFGLYLPFSAGHASHHGCPFSIGGTALCDVSLSHIEHWQTALAATLVNAILLATVLFSVYVWFGVVRQTEVQYQRYRTRSKTPERPSLYRELFSDGVLNRKAP
jgi:hypothetical protein